MEKDDFIFLLVWSIDKQMMGNKWCHPFNQSSICFRKVQELIDSMRAAGTLNNELPNMLNISYFSTLTILYKMNEGITY